MNVDLSAIVLSIIYCRLMICFFVNFFFISEYTHHLSFTKVVLFFIFLKLLSVRRIKRGWESTHHTFTLPRAVNEVNQLPRTFNQVTPEYLFQKMASCYGDGDGEGAGAVREGLRGREGLGHILPLRWTQR